MLKLLVPVLGSASAAEAARYAALLFAEECVSDVEVLQICDQPTRGRETAFHSQSELKRYEKKLARDALLQTRAILEAAGVPYRWKRVFGPPATTIAQHAAADHADVVLLDAKHLGSIHRWTILAKLWRLSPTPVTMLH